MKRLRLWVKVVLVILGVCLLLATWRLLTGWERDARQSCVEGGHTYEWCVKELNG